MTVCLNTSSASNGCSVAPRTPGSILGPLFSLQILLHGGLALSSQLSTLTSGSNAQGPDGYALDLNGFEISLSSSSFAVRQMPYPDNGGLKELRKQHEDWILSWREGTLY